MNNPNPVLSIRVITVFLLSGQQSILKKPYSARLSTTISHHSNLLPHLVMDGFEAHDSAMDSFNIDDLKSLVSLLVIGTSQTISRTDLLLELDRFRDLRIVEHRTDVASSTSSPNFTFKQPSKVVLPVEIEPCMEKSTAKKPSAKNEGKENNCFTQESLQFNPPRINFTVGNGGQVKRHGRPRRGATPHKSPPGGDVDNMPDFTSFFLFSKENVEPHSDNVTRNLKEDCFYAEFSVANTNISSTSPEFSFRLASDFTSAIEKPLFSTPSSHPKYSSPTADRLPQTTFSETFRTNCSIRDEAAISVGTHSRAEILTPQSADSAMSVDSANMEHDEVEDALDRSILDSQSRERHNGFHPQSLKFDFTPSAVKGKMDTRSEGALFSIGQHSIAHKKGEKRTSPGQRKRFDTTANASVLIDYLASVSISDTSQIDKGDAKAIAEQVIGDVMSNGSRTDPLSGQNGLIFTSGLDFKFASSNATMKESSTRAEDTASTCFDPTLCFRNPSNSFSFHSSVIKIARPPSPKKSPSATVYPAHIRRTKTPTKIVRGSPKKPQRSPSTSPMSATKSMDVDASPVPTITLRSKEIPVSARKKKQEKSPCVAPVRTENGNYGGEWDTGSDSTDDSGSDSNPRIHVAEKEACAPMSVLKPSSTSGWRGLVPDESAERMNELANQYRKQGTSIFPSYSLARCQYFSIAIIISFSLILLPSITI